MAKLTQEMVEQWIAGVTGDFYYKNVMEGQVDKALHSALRTILSRAKDKNLIAPVGKRDGWWRKVAASADEIAWWDAKPIEDDAVILPLEINKHCLIPRPSLILVAGVYNSGKSTFCINTVALNQIKWGGYLDYYVSEGAQLMKPRFEKLGIDGDSPPAFRTYTRTQNFADVLQKDSLSIIDYLRTDMESPYTVAKRIVEISEATIKNNGITVLAMQKPKGRKIAFGGDSTAWEPALYIYMEPTGTYQGYVGFEKIKVAKGYGGIDWKAIRIDYRIEYGAKFVDVKERLEYD